ncbi:MAG: YegP family protein, partial [Actinomycetes bacterium]
MAIPSTGDIRMHSEAPAEGDSSREFPELRSHSQDPAEGADAPMETVESTASGPDASISQAPSARTGQASAGTFELLVAGPGKFEFRLLSAAGELLVVSGAYSDRSSAIAGIKDARECAATARFKDHTTRHRSPTSPASPRAQ